MKKYIILLSAILLSATLSAQTISGTVYSKLSDAVLAGVSVSLDGPLSGNVSTAVNGKFVFRDLHPGVYQLKLSHLGFVSYQTTVDLSQKDVHLELFLESESGSLPEVKVISASRRNASTLHLPFASGVLNKPAQSDNIPRTTPESMNIIPGVFVQKTNHGGGSPFVRGLTGNQTLILIDGIRLNNSTFRYGPNQYMNTIDPFAIEKIEVLRGSGSVQYGSDAMGGVIQVFTKEPSFTKDRTFKGSLSARYGSGNMERTGSTEFEYSTSKLAFSGILGIKDFGDLIGGDTTGRQSPSGYTEKDASLKLKLKVTDRSDLTIANQFVLQNDVDVFHKLQLENFKINKMGVQGRNLSYLKYSINQNSALFSKIYLTGSLNSTIEERNTQKNGSLIAGLERDRIKTSSLAVEVFSDLSKFWTANSGIEYYRDGINSKRRSVNTQDGTFTLLRGLYPDQSNYSNTSVYSLQHIRFGSFNVEAGMRYNWLKASINDVDLGQLSISPGAFVWNGGVNYSTGQHHFYTSYNTGYRAPNIDDMGTLGIVDFRYEIPSYSLKPEKSYNSELGYKFASGKWNFGTSVYQNKLNNLINRVQTGQIINGYKVYRKENTEEAIIKGVEGFVEWSASRSWFFDFFASYNHGQNISRSEPLRRVPPFNGNFSLKYKVNKFYLKSELAWADKQDRLAQGDRDDNRIPLNGTPGWRVLNVYSGYTFGAAQLRISAQNLFNEDYRTHGSGVNALGRSIWMSINYTL